MIWRHDWKFPADLYEELVIDNFAGGGGASMGIELALGRSVDVAINHDREAVSMHRVNHPGTHHLCQDVWSVDPLDVTGGKPVGLAWFSPDCTYHSKARGCKPIRDVKRRDLAWVVIKWAKAVKPRVIMLENVEEFAHWGPLRNGRPCPKRRGQTFRKWVGELKACGYQVEHRELRACDYGAPTIRKRLFLIARCDGRPIIWPEKTHGQAETGTDAQRATVRGVGGGSGRRSQKAPGGGATHPRHLRPFRTAADCIDFSLPCPSIFLTPEEAKAIGCKRPLAEATLKRIANGLFRYVINADDPYIVDFTCGVGGRAGQSRPRSVREPGATTTAKADAALISPMFAAVNHGESGGRRSYRANEPMRTITASCRGGEALVAPVFVPRYGERKGQKPRARRVDQPHPTIVPDGNGASLVSPLLVGAGGPAFSGKPTSVKQPIGTLMVENRRAVVSAFIAKHFGGMVGTKADAPFPTITCRGTQNQVVAAHLCHAYGSNTNGGNGKPKRPLKTITGAPHHALIATHLTQLRGSNRRGRKVKAPAPTLTAGANHVGMVAAFLQTYYGSGSGTTGQNVAAPLPTATTEDRFSLVTVDIAGEPYVIVDIGMRMLTPRELFRCQGFPDSYVIDYGVDEHQTAIPLTKTVQVRMVGNSVCPDLSRALVEANCAELIRREAA